MEIDATLQERINALKEGVFNTPANSAFMRYCDGAQQYQGHRHTGICETHILHKPVLVCSFLQEGINALYEGVCHTPLHVNNLNMCNSSDVTWADENQ